MRKAASILLLSILLFNWCGYHLLVFLLQETANSKFEARLDDGEYDESQLVSVKIPVSYLPYYNNSGSYERVAGQVDIGGLTYKYVKRRIYNDSLELLCIADQNVMKLKSAKNEFFRFENDLRHSGQNKNQNPSPIKNLTTDYDVGDGKFKIEYIYFRGLFHFNYNIELSPAHRKPPEQPPKYCQGCRYPNATHC